MLIWSVGELLTACQAISATKWGHPPESFESQLAAMEQIYSRQFIIIDGQKLLVTVVRSPAGERIIVPLCLVEAMIDRLSATIRLGQSLQDRPSA